MDSISYRMNITLDPADIIRVFRASGINRPTDDPARISRMFGHANLTFSAWAGPTLVGVCRALTDFSYCCYVSDLAVDKAYQGRGIGTGLVDRLRAAVGEQVSIILVSAPAAAGFYPTIGFTPIEHGFIIRRKK